MRIVMPQGRRAVLTLVTALASFFWAGAASAEDFVVRDMRIEGLQRISEGTLYNYLPLNIGDTLTYQRQAEAFRAVYATGFFDNVEFRRDGNTLIIAVLERPSIAGFTIEGNKDIKTEDLEENLRGVGLAPGKTFDRSVLDNVKQFLLEQYHDRGKYGARVETEVTDLSDNKVNIAINITEGARAKIRQINIVGNEAFPDDELLEQFSLTTGNLLSFYKKDNLYARESLGGDLEALHSYYMDRGFASFSIDSTQVAISPDKKDIFIAVNITEGDRYKIADVRLSGDLVVSEPELMNLVLVKPGQTFSRKLLTQTGELISFRLGQEGFAFARIDPIPDIDDEAREVSVNMRVDPGKRAYVRRINFNGASGVNDEVFRREMRQLEGGWLSNTGVKRSEQRIRRLPFVESVEVETVPVAGSPDLVDVEFQIEEGLPGQFGGGLGYSGSQGLLLNGNFTHSNFMGTGNRVSAEINAGDFSKVYSISHTDPYRTPDGISRSISVAYRDITQFISGGSDFSTETLSAGLDYGLPLSEYQRLRLGISFQDADLLTSGTSASQAINWVTNNGNSFAVNDIQGDRCGDSLFDICGTSFKTWELSAGWSYDTRDRVIFPSRGSRHQVSLAMTVPGSEVEYYTARYNFLKFWPLWGPFTLSVKGELAFGEGLGDTSDIPPYKNFFAGGPESVRGFQNGRLGPIDSLGNPYGGNLKSVAQWELMLPTPEKLRGNTRFSLFYDIGNVFYKGGTVFTDFPDFTPGSKVNRVDYDFDFAELRQSAGVAVSWLAPLGTFRFSYAFPLSSSDDELHANGFIRLPGDDIERFQFSVGSAF